MRTALFVVAAVTTCGIAWAAPPAGDPSWVTEGESPVDLYDDGGGRAEKTPPPEWSWRQILATPNIGGRLTAIAVDPSNPKRIFVGSEEGTIIRSLDGGVTWREIELTQTVLKGRTLGLRQPSLPNLGERPAKNFRLIADPPYTPYVQRPSLFFPTLFFSIRPNFVFAGFLAPSARSRLNILADASRSRRSRTVPIRRITFCPGNVFPLLVASARAVYGSFDDGLTFVRLFSLPKNGGGRVEAGGVYRRGTLIDHVVCAREDSRRVGVASTIGLFLSEDGGLSFDQELSGWPGQPATAISYAPPKPGSDKPTLFYAASDLVFAGDPSSSNGLQEVYPDYNDATTAPWKSVRWIEVSRGGRIWRATDDGVRTSPDGGKSWSVPARTLMARQPVIQVVTGVTEDGRERVALLAKGFPATYRRVPLPVEDQLYVSDDGGETWHPFFNGTTRRSFTQIASARRPEGGASQWWVVTSGGVWTTHGVAKGPRPVDRSAQKWARTKLARTPPLSQVIRCALENTELSQPKLENIWSRITGREWLPQLQTQLRYRHRGYDLQAEQQVTTPYLYSETDARRKFDFFVNARWNLFWTGVALEEASRSIRGPLHELRRQISFATEDAWHERAMLLGRLARGLSDPIQVETTKTRILALEAVLAVWLETPLEELI